MPVPAASFEKRRGFTSTSSRFSMLRSYRQITAPQADFRSEVPGFQDDPISFPTRNLHTSSPLHRRIHNVPLYRKTMHLWVSTRRSDKTDGLCCYSMDTCPDFYRKHWPGAFLRLSKIQICFHPYLINLFIIPTKGYPFVNHYILRVKLHRFKYYP